MGIPIRYLAWVSALLPMITYHGSYLLAASWGHVEWCVPYWDSCTSISATGRQLPAKYFFKFGIIPAALVTMILWWVLWRWCHLQIKPEIQARILAMPVLGSLAALFLIQYTLALGEAGDAYRFLRRTGVILAFAFTFIAQVLFTRRIKQLGQQQQCYRAWYVRLLILQLLLLVIGITSVVLDAMMGLAYDRIEDAFEWWMALLLNGYFVMLAIMLGKSQGRLDVLIR